MSWLPSNDPVLGDQHSCDALELVIVPRTRDLGDGFEVRRALPHGKRQMVGPFIFFDHFGPVQFMSGQGHGRAPASAYRACHRHLSVRRQHHAPRQRGQHPGNPARRDEPDDRRAAASPIPSARPTCSAATARRCCGLQSWIALPATSEEIAPSFQHFAAADLPSIDGRRRSPRASSPAARSARSRR